MCTYDLVHDFEADRSELIEHLELALRRVGEHAIDHALVDAPAIISSLFRRYLLDHKRREIASKQSMIALSKLCLKMINGQERFMVILINHLFKNIIHNMLCIE